MFKAKGVAVKRLLLFLLFLSGCAINPVTGRQELVLIPQAMEIEMGEENYLAARQIQGGDYVVDGRIVEYVREVGARIAAVSDRKLPYEFVVVNDSTPNAWAMPGGKIAIHRGLLTQLQDEAELAAVLAHEVVHAAARHSARQIERAMLLQGAVLLTAALVDRADRSDDWTGRIAIGGAQVAAFLLTQRFSRDAEREADHYGMVYMSRAGYDPSAAVRLQETFVRLSKGRDEGWLGGLLSTHPPSRERVEANRATLAKLPQGGEVGKERYMEVMATLFRTEPAYEAYDRGMVALKEGRFGEALRLAEEAISIEPREALFYTLKGDALERMGRPYQALKAYEKAISLNPGYYYPHQQKGLLLYRMGRLWEARYALETGIGLLETAPAVHVLGRIALTQGRYEEARRYFKAARESDSEAGMMAWRDLLRMDLPERAEEYVSATLSIGDGGEPIIEVTNNTPLAIRDVVLYIESPARQDYYTVPGLLKGGETRVVKAGPSGLRPEDIGDYSLRVVSAYLAE